MRILIVSDTHKKHKNLELLLARVQPIDVLLHLGDSVGYADYIEDLAGCRTEIVAGNNDFASVLHQEKEIILGKYKILMTHGHYYYVNSGIEDLKKEAKARGFDIVLFGHTHVPIIDYGDGIIAMNPGSISFPRQEGGRPSYIWMEIDKKGNGHFEIEYL